jgi:hypothetical protein
MCVCVCVCVQAERGDYTFLQDSSADISIMYSTILEFILIKISEQYILQCEVR